MFRRIFLFALLLLLLAAPWSRAVEVVGGVEVVSTSPTSAKVRWRTDVATGSRVTYGLSAGRLNKSADGSGVTAAHEVVLKGLQAGTKYFFTVGTSRKQLTSGQFTTSSSAATSSAPASKSPASSPAATPQPSPPAVKDSAQAPPPARETWGSMASLQDHFSRHGADFHAKSAEDYAAQAWQFRQKAKAGGLQVKVDDDGVQRVFDPATGAFAAYNRDGTTKTYFKPGSRGYFTRQPGKTVKTLTP